MGIRPQFHILVGVDDARPDDERYIGVDAAYLEDVLNFRELKPGEYYTDGDIWDDQRDTSNKVPGQSPWLRDRLYNPELSDEYTFGNIIGMVVHEGPYDDDILRAFAAIDEKYLERGWERIPTMNPGEHHLRYAHYGYNKRDVECNRFVPGVFESWPGVSRIYWARARHYLKLVGWDIPEEDLRYLLVWDWS